MADLNDFAPPSPSEMRVEWDSPAQRWLLVTYKARWQWNDIAELKQTVDAVLNSVPHEVGALVDMRASNFVIPNAVPNISKAFATAPRNVGLLAVVGANRFFRVVIMIVRQMLPNSPLQHLIFVATMEEAHQLLEARYPAPHPTDV
jgi:hypothetical protein